MTNVVSLLGNVNAATAARPDQLLIGTAQYQYQTALAGGTTQIFRMMGPLLELMAEAARHEEDDYGRTIHATNYATINTTLAEIAVLLFETNGSDIGSNSNVYRRNVLAPTAPLRLKIDDEETAEPDEADATAGANPMVLVRLELCGGGPDGCSFGLRGGLGGNEPGMTLV